MGIATFLNGTTATQLRGALFLALSETGVRHALTATTDSGGGATQTWAATGTIECRVDPLSSGTGPVTGGQIDERSTHLVTVPGGFVVGTGDRFAISGRGTFEVTATRQRTASPVELFEVLAL